VFYHVAAYAARGRIFPAPGRGNPAPRDSHQAELRLSLPPAGAKPATGRVADGESGKGGAFAPIPGDDEH